MERFEVRLFKAFYYAHLAYYQDNVGVLTQYPIVHMPMGPGIDSATQLLEDLKVENRLDSKIDDTGACKEWVFTLLKPVSFSEHDPKYAAISKGYGKVRNKTAQELSDVTHEKSYSWRNTTDGQEQDIYLDLMEETEIKRIRRETMELEAKLYEELGEAL